MQTAAPDKIWLTSNSLTNTVMYLFMYFNNSYTHLFLCYPMLFWNDGSLRRWWQPCVSSLPPVLFPERQKKNVSRLMAEWHHVRFTILRMSLQLQSVLLWPQAEFLSWSMFVHSYKELASCHEFHFLIQPGFLYLFAFISEIHVPFNLACWEGNKLLFQ